jgi:uncharacterized protein
MPDILVRHLDFDFEEDKAVDAEFIPGDPEMSYFMVGLSMILPYLEPHLVKHTIAGQKCITDKSLLHDMQQFVRQEAAHYKEHKRFNDRVRAAYPGLESLEMEVAADYVRFAEKGLKFNLAYAEGFESLTQPWAIFMWESGMIKQMKGPLADIYTWHILEEIEHRTVAFDAYYFLHDDYFFRFRVSLLAQYHLIRFMLRCTLVMLKQEKARFNQRGGWAGRTKRISKWIGLACKYLFPQLLKTYLPSYNPRNLKVPSVLTELTETYSARAYKTTR